MLYNLADLSQMMDVAVLFASLAYRVAHMCIINNLSSYLSSVLGWWVTGVLPAVALNARWWAHVD